MKNVKSATAVAIAALGISLSLVPFTANAADTSQARIAAPANYVIQAVDDQFQEAEIIEANGRRGFNRGFRGRGFNRGFRGRGFNRFGNSRFRNDRFFYSGSRGFRNSRFHHGNRHHSYHGHHYSR
ncbi:hypothetical protein N9L47_03700 [Rhodobacteraceae bacterium]|nr:hypothetical protein [Paracoccaceae bacterium]